MNSITLGIPEDLARNLADAKAGLKKLHTESEFWGPNQAATQEGWLEKIAIAEAEIRGFLRGREALLEL